MSHDGKSCPKRYDCFQALRQQQHKCVFIAVQVESQCHVLKTFFFGSSLFRLKPCYTHVFAFHLLHCALVYKSKRITRVIRFFIEFIVVIDTFIVYITTMVSACLLLMLHIKQKKKRVKFSILGQFFFSFLPFFSFLVFIFFLIFQTSYANPQTYKKTNML